MQFFKEIKKTALGNSLVQYGLKRLNSENMNEKSEVKQPRKPFQEIVEQNEEPDEQTAIVFVKNLIDMRKIREKQAKIKKNKIKQKAFENLQIDPLYAENQIGSKLLTLELDDIPDKLYDRMQHLIYERDTVHKTILNILFTTYLWEYYDMEHQNFLISSFDIIHEYTDRLNILIQKQKQQRKILNLLYFKVMKIKNIIKRRKIIKQKLKRLKTLREYKKEKDLQKITKNIDQIFFIDRDRQKHYIQIIKNEEFTAKYACLKDSRQKMVIQTRKNMDIVQKTLKKWIDQKKQLSKKEIQKMFILIYFSKTHPMYTDSGITIEWQKIKNLNLLLEKINQVRSWDDLKYVNDYYKKGSVKIFLGSCSDEIRKLQLKSNGD